MSNSSSILPSFSELESSIAPKQSPSLLLEKLEKQFQYNKGTDKYRFIYSKDFPSDMVLDLNDRHLLVERYLDSGDTSYKVQANRFNELRIFKKNGNDLSVTRKLIKAISS